VILLIDNYDSFTWNLVHRLGEVDPTLEIGRDLVVRRHDEITPEQAEVLDGGRPPSHIVISPGPCTPKEAGISGAMIGHFGGRVPVLGVCLGHQCIADLHGMRVVRHETPMHGKTSQISHDGLGIFEGLENPFCAMRYHSLVIDAASMPEPPQEGQDGWVVSAWCEDSLADGRKVRVVMGLRRVWQDGSKAPLVGVQFHPESFMTPSGYRLLANFLRMGDRPRSPNDVAPLERAARGEGVGA